MKYTGLKSYEIENYKSINNSGEIQLDAASIILGPNSSGKTNLMEPLLLLKQSMDTRGTNLTLNSEYVKLGNYEDIVYMQDKHRDISYKFNFEYNNTPQDEDRPLECPICQENYKEKGWYKNHLEEVHEIFWQKESNNVELYENFPPKNPEITIKYTYDEKSSSNTLKQIIFSNPVPVGGLYLSELRVTFSIDKISISAKDIHGNVVFDSGINKKKFSNYNFSRISETDTIVEGLLREYTTADRGAGRYLAYSSNQPYIADDKMPTVSDNYNLVDSICSKVISFEDDSVDLSEYTEDEKALFNGLLMRLSSIVDRSMITVGTIERLVENTFHVGSLRRSPQRIYSASGADSRGQYFRGSDIEQRLFNDIDQGTPPILEKINKWLEETGFNCEIEIDRVSVGDIFQLKVREGELSVNLADSGFGLSQTIPIIIECVSMLTSDSSGRQSAFFTPPSIEQHLTIIEEPEIHLNPKIEARMGDFFLDIQEDHTGILIETHSEHIVNRIQRRIAEGTIDTDDVAVYFVEKEGKQTNVKNINISDDGSFEHWPEGFFQEDFDDAIEILKNRVESEDE